MKRKIIFVMLLLETILLNSCAGKEGKQNEINGSSEWVTLWDRYTYGDAGVFYADNTYLRFLDPGSGLDVLICDRPDCSHQKGDCPAEFNAMIAAAAWENGHLTLVTDYKANRYGEMFLYECDTNGENRRQIAALGDMEHIYGAHFTEDYIVMSWQNQYDDNMQPLEMPETGVTLYDRNTKESRIIWNLKAVGALTYQPIYEEDAVYWISLYYDITQKELLAHETDRDYMDDHLRVELYRYDMADGRTEVLAEGMDNLAYAIVEGGIFIERNDGLYLYHTEERTEEWIGEGMRTISTFLEGQQILSKYEQGTWCFYLYEEESGEITELGSSNSCNLSAVFEQTSYLRYAAEDGRTSMAFLDTSKLLNGELDSRILFEQ